MLLATVFDGLFESPDGGLTWAPVGPPNQPFQELVPLDSRTFLDLDGAGLERSTDGGVTWTRVLDVPVLKLQPDPTNRSIVYAAEFERNDSTFPLVRHPFLVKSEDGGATWHPILDPGGSLALDPEHAATLYALANGDLVKTTDGGTTWARVAAYPDPYAKLLFDTDLLVDPHAGSTLYGTSFQQGVLRSTDDGVTWTPAVLTPPIDSGAPPAPGAVDQRLYADPFVPHRIYAAVGRRLYVASF